MKVPQIKKPIHSLLLIFLGVPLLALASSSVEIHTYKELVEFVLKCLRDSVKVSAGWILFKSPWAAEIQGAVRQESDSVTTKLSGDVITQHVETTTVAMKPSKEE